MPDRRSVLVAAASFVASPARAIRPAEICTIDRRLDRSDGPPRHWLELMAGAGPLGAVLMATREDPDTRRGTGVLVSRLDGGGGYEVDGRSAAALRERAFRETAFVLRVAVDEAAFQALSALIERARRRGRSADHATVMGWLATAARLARLTVPPGAAHPAGFVRALCALDR